jgi:hypothetical protein
LPYQRELVSDAITITLGTSHGPRHPLIVSWSRLSRPRRRHSAFSHSAGTSGRPRSTAPQQQPWHTSTCPITRRFVVKVVAAVTSLGFQMILYPSIVQ